MTSRKRTNSSTSSSDKSRSRAKNSNKKRTSKRQSRRQHLLETLETRQLLAGPQLIGIQPNEGDLIVDGSTRDTAPRVLTFRFDEDQNINTGTFSGIQISRAGADDQLGTADDVRIEPGLVTLGDPNQNEVVVRFAETLPDDNYRVEVFGFDDPGLGVLGLRNEDGEFFVAEDPTQRVQTIDFSLRLGALVESVVPQPVVRRDDGSLVQNRNEIVVYFNEDPLFTEDDDNGVPTARSAENPRFYQLLLTQDSVRTTDDLLYYPDEVVYDEATHTSRLFFAGDINDLPGVQQGGGTFRLRVGTAVDDRVDLIIRPTNVAVAPSVTFDLGTPDSDVIFRSTAAGESGSGQVVRFEDSNVGGLTARVDAGEIIFDLGGDTPSISELQAVSEATASVDALVNIVFAPATGTGLLPVRLVGGAPLVLTAVGDTLGTALDVGVFGQDTRLTSLVFSESIDAQPFAIELPGGNDDPGHRQLPETAGQSFIQHVNQEFGADVTSGITEVAYNFNGIFDTDGSGNNFLNQITERQKERVREALELWESEIGVQFRETADEGITFALGNTANLQTVTDTTLRNVNVLNAAVRVDPTFAESAIVFSNQVDFGTAYGEDFLRKATAGVGVILGLEQALELEPQVLLNLSAQFLNTSIDSNSDLEPVFPSEADALHGQYLHRPDSVDVDLYRFVVDLDDADKTGTLSAETFAERLTDSSLLDTALTLYQEQRANKTIDFGVGTELEVKFEAVAEGTLGNNARVDFLQSDRAVGDTEIRIIPQFDSAGVQVTNAFTVDMPRRNGNVTSVPVGDIVNAINNHPMASTILRASILIGTPGIDVSGSSLSFSPVLLSGGGLTQLSRNDDYFSEDSRLSATLGAGIYYVGVSASGNDSYDPTIANSGYGGLTQGRYELHLKFEPQVDETDVLRDRDSDRVGVPGARLDGNGDGIPGGVHNFWFQTAPESRLIEFTDNGAAVTPHQTVTIESVNSVTRTYEFVPIGEFASPGNLPVFYNAGSIGAPTPSGNLAAAFQAAINQREGETGVHASLDLTTLTLSGDRTLTFSTGFRGATAHGRTIFVDKTAGPLADGSLDRPFNNISNPDVANAFESAMNGDIVRIVGNGGGDGDISTEGDNFSYQIGFSDTGGQTLVDGRAMEVPQGVTTMIDAGAILKFRGSRIGVGSSTLQVDRSNGALQVLGAPRLVQLSESGAPVTTTLIGNETSDTGGYDDGSVILTSLRDRDADTQAAGISADPTAGNWGGIVYRRDLDQAQGRTDLEDHGIFLNRVNHAEIRYGGSSNLLIDSVQQLVNPIQIINMRPTISFNEISFSADAAISAAPDSFEETSFQAPRFQQAGSFTADYSRVGPDMHNNVLVDNSINGVFVRVATTSTDAPRELTVAGRFDDIDVVHYIAENVVVTGTPGGSIQDGFAPSMGLVSGRVLAGGVLDVGTYRYKMTFVDQFGFESLASVDDFSIAVTQNDSSVEVTGLAVIGNRPDYVSRRLYRAFDDGSTLQYQLVADLDASSASHFDRGTASDGVLDLGRTGVRGRLDASLVMDPGLVLKSRGSRFEFGVGTQLLAEGTASHPVIFTSAFDDRYGAGGTFDTNNDNETPGGENDPTRGDWSGIYASPTSLISLDNAVVSYAGGISLLEGGSSRGFAALELQQAEARITNSRFEFNEDGQDGAGPQGRFGRLNVTPSTIFVRGSQPIIVGNTFTDNHGSIIDIDVDSMIADYIGDPGRQTGPIERFTELDDNQGPLVRYNRYENVPTDSNAAKQITGLEIRGGNVIGETVFDDTDIVHLMFDSITVDNFHSSGGLTLKSRPDESLVVKLSGAGNANGPTTGTGLTATGSESDIADRIGGTVHVLGLPGAPVVLTSFQDDTVGAGLKPDGSQFTDSNGDSFGSRPLPNDWRSIFLDQFSNDRNFDAILEQELSTDSAPGLNGTVENAQFLGELAPALIASDEVQRLGFDVQGYLGQTNDVDTYSFIGTPGTEVWIDIDRTSFTLDSVIEILDENGTLLARSDNSFAEISGDEDLNVVSSDLQGVTSSLQARDNDYTDFGVGGLYEDFGSTNTRDAGIHFSLPGNVGSASTKSVYFFRVRSASINPDDVAGGLTRGAYQFQVRLTEDDEFAGSKIEYTDIRYANHGIHVRGLPGTSSLLGEAQENESVAGNAANNNQIDSGGLLGQRPQNLGNLVDNKAGVISVAGSLSNAADVDFYQIDINHNGVGGASYNQSTVFDIDYADGLSRPDTNISVFYDPDGDFGFQAPRLVLFGADSNVLDDQTSPFGENDASEKLSRGSVGTGDPLVGPVSLIEGSYYVAVTGDGIEPLELSNPDVRREPINSVQRIVEDRINSASASTASGPVLVELFSDAAVAASGFLEEVEASNGHGKPLHFDGTGASSASSTGGVYAETLVAGGDAASLSLVGAPDLDSFDWSVNSDPNIGSQFGGTNTSTSTPHITVNGTLLSDFGDFYQFDVTNDFSRVILDVDGGHNPFAPDTDATSVDTQLVLIRDDGTLSIIATDDNGFASEGADGSVGDPLFSFFTDDPFIERTLNIGSYYVGVVPTTTTVSIDALSNTIDVDATEVPTTLSTYSLNISVEGHALPTNAGNLTLHFPRSAGAAPAVLTSESFDLTGYTASDLPNLYFNYRLDAAGGDSVEVRVLSDNNPAGQVVASSGAGDLVSDSSWRQLIPSLGNFAGDTGVRVEFTYTSGAGGGTNSGLFLDDFIVGFAERGETIFNARDGVDAFNGTANSVSGEYQLETRLGTSYTQAASDGGEELVSDFDTNDRHSQSITIVAPAGDQIADGDTFIIGDGAANQVFEFTTTPGSVTFGNTPVLFNPADSPAEIATSMRTAISQQTQISIEASSSSGADTQALSDGRISLSGSARGSFVSIGSFRNAPPAGSPLITDADGHLLLPAVLHDGVGDENYTRAQSLVIVSSNTISDVHGIGVWSEPGIRDIDPADQFGAQGTSAPPVGNPYPGAARNLPTLNDSVVGGLSPGIVVSNNTIDQAGYTAIKVEGETRPFMIEVPGGGDDVSDGALMAIDHGGTRVIFEFEDIGGDITTNSGSGAAGGDGVTDGHVPIYYRRTFPGATGYRGRNTPYTADEMADAIADAIRGSILVTNQFAQLATVTVGPSLRSNGVDIIGNPTGTPIAAAYVTGVSGIYVDTFRAETPLRANISVTIAPVAEPTQPFSRIVNNTIYGADGTASTFAEVPDGSVDDTIADALDTKLGQSHRSLYSESAVIGDNTGLIDPAADVDFYKVELSTGDRLIVDIDTLDADVANGILEGPDTIIKIYDDRGFEQTFFTDANSNVQSTVGSVGTTPDHLEPTSTATTKQNDAINGRDGFADFTSTKTGTYYVAISSEGNASYDATDISGRSAGAGGTGDYTISLQTYTPRSFVITADSGSTADTGGVTGASVGGEVITITQIADVNGARVPNEVTFGFGAGTGADVTVNVNANDRMPAIMIALTNAINSTTRLRNHAFGNGPDGRSGPLLPPQAFAIGGTDAGNIDVTRAADRNFNGDGGLFGDGGRFQRLGSTTEQYVVLELAAEVDVSNAPSFRIDPQPNRDTDQVLNETGVMLAGGSSGTLLNNVFLNLHESFVIEETSFSGFGINVGDSHVKPSEVIVVGSVFQHDETQETILNTNIEWRTRANTRYANTNGLQTDRAASNLNGDSDDFNVRLGNVDPAVVNAEGDNFQPAFDSILIDSSINSLVERDAFRNLKNSVGLPSSNILTPNRDVFGVLRADNPNYSPPGGIGGSVFKDRGSTELADFVGPVAIAEVPRDNDSEGLDSDPAISFIRLTEGVYDEIRIQLRDNGDASDPFTGIGIDDSTVVVPEIAGLRTTGSTFTLFEDDRLLTQGIDYTFNYDETKNIVTLTPLAGVWQDDRSYRVAINNRDRTVLTVPPASELSDGDQLSITDSNGGTVVFEVESGYQLLVPETLTLTIPQVGTNAGGVRDGDVFTLNDGQNSPVVFEYNSDSASLPGSIQIPLSSDPTPTDAAALEVFLAQIATDTRDAIQSQVTAGNLNLSVTVDGTNVVIGTEAGAVLKTGTSGIQQATRTLGLEIPASGFTAAGISDGETFTISANGFTFTYEFESGDGLNSPQNLPINLTPGMTGSEVAAEITSVLGLSALELTTQTYQTRTGESVVYLNLPVNGTITTSQGAVEVVGISRTATDGDTISVSPNNGDPAVVLEINRTDEPGDDGVSAGNLSVNITRSTTATELANLIANSLQSQLIPGLDPNGITTVAGGQVSIGGEDGLGLSLTGASLEVVGSPSVTGSSTVQVFGPLLLELPVIGGASFVDGSGLILKDDAGTDVIFEFNLNGTPQTVLNALPIQYNSFDNVLQLADAIVLAINNAQIGITATNLSNGSVSLGRIADSRVNLGGNAGLGLAGVPQIVQTRGIVNDGERLTIRQGADAVTFEFESVNNGGGVNPGSIAVAFQPNSTIGDVAVSLAAAINNNKGALRISAQAVIGSNGVATGEVTLNDLPGTVVDVSAAPTLSVVGVPGGSVPIRISPAFSATQVKQALLLAINGVNPENDAPVTTLSAEDRGGATLFVEDGLLFDGPFETYYLAGIKDLAGNLLEPNRNDLTTQYTILMPTVSLDYGDAPDPVQDVPGRYPTLRSDDGARHVVTPNLTLGTSVDANLDGLANRNADGDDLTLSASATGSLFTVSLVDGAAVITVTGSDPVAAEGDTITINAGVVSAALEFDLNGRFDEDSFAISPVSPVTQSSIAQAIAEAITESPLSPASVLVDGNVVTIASDDEDGVIFTSQVNPGGVLNHNIQTPVSVTVTGAGTLEAWVDYNADGDWDDPGEQVIGLGTPGAIFSDAGMPLTRTFDLSMPDTAPVPPFTLQTYARFRVSREGGLAPTGLALSGEVEDYALTLLAGSPPVLTAGQANRSYTLDEDRVLQAIDTNGLDGSTNNDGLIEGVVDPDGDLVEIFDGDVGTHMLTTTDGTFAGQLDLSSDGAFVFNPATDFFGEVVFEARVTDVKADVASQLVSSTPVSVTLTVRPVNDPPVLTAAAAPLIQTTGQEDVAVTFTIDQLATPFYSPGPANESSQQFVVRSAGDGPARPFQTELGGLLTIAADGQSVTYTPPLDYHGTAADSFVYTIADVPGAGQLSEVAAEVGRVEIVLTPVNDNPVAGADAFTTPANQNLHIVIASLLANDTVGPANELNETPPQVLSFVAGQFDSGVATFRGGTVTSSGTGTTIIYSPPQDFSGTDQFTYQIADGKGGFSSGTVSVAVNGAANAPVFVGVNGNPSSEVITRTEGKVDPQVIVFDLNTWFTDPEGGVLSFSAVSANTANATVSVNGNQMTLTIPPLRSGETAITVTATDPDFNSTPQVVTLDVTNTPDPPVLVNPFGSRSVNEDQTITIDLSAIFSDADGDVLTYSVNQLRGIFSPSEADIANDPLVKSIDFVAGTPTTPPLLVITPEADQSGTVQIEITAMDSATRVGDILTLTVVAQPDAPVATGESETVSIGSVLRQLNPAGGLLSNDIDADGDTLTVDTSSVTATQFGSVLVNDDGTYVYTNTSGDVGQTDSFQYRVSDGNGLVSNLVTVEITLTRSEYQNPVGVDSDNISVDVNADGRQSALDALLVINLLSRAGGVSSLPVSEIGAPPPNYYDVNGDGIVSVRDANSVITRLARAQSPASGEGEQAVQFAVSTSIAAASSTLNLPVRDLEPATLTASESKDALLTAGLAVESNENYAVIEVMTSDSVATDSGVDDALTEFLDESMLD